MPKIRKNKKKKSSFSSKGIYGILISLVVVLLSIYYQEIGAILGDLASDFNSLISDLNPIGIRWRNDWSLLISVDNSCNLETINYKDLTTEKFIHEFLDKKPVLIRGGTEQWKANNKWTKKEMLHSYGNETIFIGQGPEITQGGGSSHIPIQLEDFVESLDQK